MVTSQSGTLPVDQMDSMIWNQVNTLGKGTAGQGAGTSGPSSLYTSQTQTGLPNNGYGNLKGGVKPTDTDNDGMPDFWEKAMGSNVTKDDAMTIGADGYALIEGYINWLGDAHARVSSGAVVDIDLAALTQGFKSVTPTFSVTNPVKGTVALLSNARTARFTPVAGATGTGSFAFTVKGSDGTTWTSSVSVLVEPGTTGLEGSPEAATGFANAQVVWMDVQGRELLREVQLLDRHDPCPVAPQGMTGVRIARVQMDGQAPLSIRTMQLPH
jgi:hypothetical protein